MKNKEFPQGNSSLQETSSYEKKYFFKKNLQGNSQNKDEIKDKKQLQRFLGCLNYVSDYFKDLRMNPYITQKTTPAWTEHQKP